MKNGSASISVADGRVEGLDRNNLLISVLASSEMWHGIRYSLRLMRWYVSLRLLVSKGGLPTSRVNLQGTMSTLSNG